jgi:hypothetical protein
MGDPVPSRPRPSSDKIHCSVSPEANLGWETLLRLARGQPRVGDAVTIRTKPALGGRSSHDLPEVNL